MSSGADPAVALLTDAGCFLRDGHFKLVSGKHSESYLQVRVAMMLPRVREAFAEGIAAQLTPAPDFIAAWTTGGLLLAQRVAELLRCRLLVGRPASRTVEWLDNGDVTSHLEGQSVVALDDVLTTGGTLRNALNSLDEAGAEIVRVFVAVNRSIEPVLVTVGTSSISVDSFRSIPLTARDPSECHLCAAGVPYVNLHNPEDDPISVVLSMPPEMSSDIVEGYRHVFRLQNDSAALDGLNEVEPWLEVLVAGLPRARMGEDSGLVQFIRRFVVGDLVDQQRIRVLVDLIGHLLALPHIRVETRALGCSILVGDRRRLDRLVEMRAPVRVPDQTRSGAWAHLVPYFDALSEQEIVFLIDNGGELFGIRRLTRQSDVGPTRGIQLLRQLTEDAPALGLIVRRERKALNVYRQGRLEGVAELSEKTGMWEFVSPRPIVDEVVERVPGITKTLEAVLEVAREMVNRGYGGLFVIGNEFPHADSPKVDIAASQPLAALGVAETAELAKLDGACFVTQDGLLASISRIIINTQTDDATQIAKSGARRKTAWRTSRELPSAAVVCVSQNGMIDIFVDGASWPVSESITGVR